MQRAGTEVLFATDEWFAVAGNLNQEDPPKFDPNAFDNEGKLMDDWETRRKRTAGHDWCIMKLGLEGVIRGVEADTSFFTGNQVPRISIQAANLSAPLPLPPWNAKPRKGTKASEVSDVYCTVADCLVLTIARTRLGRAGGSLRSYGVRNGQVDDDCADVSVEAGVYRYVPTFL